MTYGNFKTTVEAMLGADLVLPEKDEQVIALVGMGLIYIANKATSLKLLTIDGNDKISRRSYDDMLVREAKLPILVDPISQDVYTEEQVNAQLIDIDNDLCYALVRLLVSYVATEEKVIIRNEGVALALIGDFNKKINAMCHSRVYDYVK